MMKFLRPLLLVAAASLGAFGLQQLAPTARAAMWQWSTTAASNATADPSINWSEGMSPSSVNDSARAMMSVLAAWRNDITGVTSTTGGPTAYVLTSNQGGFVANTGHDGFLIGFTLNVTNAAGANTINVDGAGAKPLRSSTATNMTAGVLVAGSKYLASYKFSTDEWLLLNSYATQFEVPLGTMLAYTGVAVPNANYLFAVGQCINRVTYAAYFNIVGTAYGACDGSTTFAIPDMRGRFPGGSDEMGGASAAGRITIAGCVSNFFNVLGLTCGTQTRTLVANQIPQLSGTTQSANNVLGWIGNFLSYATGANNDPQPVNLGADARTVTVNAGTQVATPIMNPSIVVNYIVRIN